MKEKIVSQIMQNWLNFLLLRTSDIIGTLADKKKKPQATAQGLPKYKTFC